VSSLPDEDQRFALPVLALRWSTVSSRCLGALRYTRTAVALHWILGVAIIGQILFGWFLNTVPRGTPERSLYVNLHKSTGLTLGLLIVVRFLWRWSHEPPPLPASVPTWERIAADVSHRLLYVCMLIMPVTGYIASNFSEWGVKYFNVILLPPWGIEDETIYAFFNGTHVVTSYVFVALIGVHVVSAVRHALLRDGVFGRMWPKRR
jgi:cytochrome b561